MKMLCIDPSIVALGISIMEKTTLIHAETFKPKSKGEDRLKEIALHIEKIMSEFQPDVLAIETQFLGGIRSMSVLKTCEVKGVCRGVFMLKNKEGIVVDVTPKEAKQTIGVANFKGKQIKQMTQKTIYQLFPKAAEWKLDHNACDAIMIGLAVKNIILKSF